MISPSGAAVQQGGGGTTHSEYLLALSESGIFSALTFIALLVVSLYVSLKIFTKSHSKKIKIISICMLLGLVSYFTHALFNNFLDDCKLAFLFWFSLSVLATIDSGTLERKIPV
jgi:O-antigen ligase